MERELGSNYLTRFRRITFPSLPWKRGRNLLSACLLFTSCSRHRIFRKRAICSKEKARDTTPSTRLHLSTSCRRGRRTYLSLYVLLENTHTQAPFNIQYPHQRDPRFREPGIFIPPYVLARRIGTYVARPRLRMCASVPSQKESADATCFLFGSVDRFLNIPRRTWLVGRCYGIRAHHHREKQTDKARARTVLRERVLQRVT